MKRGKLGRSFFAREAFMTSTDSSKPNESAAAEQLFQLAMGFIPAISVNVVAKLSIAEQLAAGPKTAEE
jgi:hypothetical protein